MQRILAFSPIENENNGSLPPIPSTHPPPSLWGIKIVKKYTGGTNGRGAASIAKQ